MAKCVLRVDKYTKAESSKVNLHNNRKFKNTDEAKNIDRQRTALNEKFFGSDNLNKDLEKALQNNTNKRALRKDANVMLEVVLSASPEYFFKDFDKEKFELMSVEKNKKQISELYKNKLNKSALENYKKEILEFCKTDEFFKNNVISIDLHMDEKTPHFHVCLVPKMPDGRICCKEYWTPQRTLELQNRYAAHCQKLGLERGQENSEAVHTSHHNYKLNVPEPPAVKIPELEKPTIFTKSSTVYENAIEREKAQGIKYKFYKSFYEDNKRTVAYSKTQEIQLKLYKKENKQLKLSQKRHKEEEFKNLKTINIETVCQELGFKLSKKQINSKTYKVAIKENQEIVYDENNRFSETLSKRTGQGAISFLTECANFRFEQAIAFLRKHFSSKEVSQELLSKNHSESALDLISKQIDIISIEQKNRNSESQQIKQEFEFSLKKEKFVEQQEIEQPIQKKNGLRMRM